MEKLKNIKSVVLAAAVTTIVPTSDIDLDKESERREQGLFVLGTDSSADMFHGATRAFDATNGEYVSGPPVNILRLRRGEQSD